MAIVRVRHIQNDQRGPCPISCFVTAEGGEHVDTSKPRNSLNARNKVPQCAVQQKHTSAIADAYQKVLGSSLLW